MDPWMQIRMWPVGLPCVLTMGLLVGAMSDSAGAAQSSPAQQQQNVVSVGALLQQASQFETEKRFDEAIATYRKALRRRPDDDEIRGHLARVLSWQGHLTESIALHRDMLTRYPADADLRIALARVLSWDKQFAESERLAREVLSEVPTNAEAARVLADTLAWSGKAAEALPFYEAVYRDTRDVEVAQRIAAVKAELAEAEKIQTQAHAEATARNAAETLDKQVVAARELSWKGQYDGAIAGYRAVLNQDPQQMDAMRGLADVLGWSGRTAEALPLYEAVYGATQDAEVAQRIAAVKAELAEAEKIQTQAQAESATRAAAEAREKNVVAARELSWKGQYDEAIAGYRGVLAQDPQHLEAKQGLADTYYWSGRYAEALALYQEVYAATSDPALPGRIQAVKTELNVSIRAPIRRAGDGLMLPYRDYLKLGYSHYTYTNGFPDERNFLIEAAKPIGNMTLVGRIEPLNRFGLHDTPLSAELYSPLWRGAWGYIAGSGAFDASFVPVWSAGSEVFQNLGVVVPALSFLEASMGYKRMEFKTAGIDLLTPGLTIFLPWNLWLTEKISYVPAQGAMTLSSQLTWRPQDRWQFYVSGAYGTAGERIRAVQDFTRITSTIWQAGATFPITARFSGELSGYYEDRGFLYIRRGLTFNLIWHW